MGTTIETEKAEAHLKEMESQANTAIPELPQIIEESDAAFEEMLAAYDATFNSLTEGQVVEGTVLKITDKAVVVDVGYKSEGMISLGEFRSEEGNPEVEVGDKVEVLLEHAEGRDGFVVLSREKAERVKIWDTIELAYQEQSIVKGRVIERIKGGLAVDIGVRAFSRALRLICIPSATWTCSRGKSSTCVSSR